MVSSVLSMSIVGAGVAGLVKSRSRAEVLGLGARTLGARAHQDVTLAVRLKRAAFDETLAAAVHSSFAPAIYKDDEEWGSALKRSSVVLQWDPDHAPSGHAVERRAMQLGLRGAALRSYAREWIVEIEDISPFVAEQREHARSGHDERLVLPREDVYPVTDPIVAARLKLS